MRLFLAFALSLVPGTVKALDKEEVRKAFAFERGEPVIRTTAKEAFEFERMKMRSDYPTDLAKATKEGQLFVLWVDYEDASLYGWFQANLPDAIHSFATGVDAHKGITLGICHNSKVGLAREVDAYTLSAPKIKEVILTIASGQVTSPAATQNAKGDVHSHTCASCGTTWWHSSSDPKASHNCPNCGKYQNVISAFAPAQSRASPDYVWNSFQPSCPNGNCAIPRR